MEHLPARPFLIGVAGGSSSGKTTVAERLAELASTAHLALLKLYSYYKQATDGDAKGDRPGGFDFVGAAKHDAWAKLKGMSKDEAMQNYIKQVDKLNRD